MTDLCRIDIAVFAHNEEQNMQAMLETLARQDIFAQLGLSVHVMICANGCTDRTVEVAQSVIAGLVPPKNYEVLDLPQGGKSRTWNYFVHDASRKDADFLIFCDADISIPEADMLRRLITFIQERPAIAAASSRPVKDIVHAPQKLSLSDKIIAAAGGTLNDWRKSICGQLYVMRAPVSRSFHLPIGLPVEDGFVRAMTLTDVFQGPEDLNRIDGDEGLLHVYKSERSARALIRHQVRIVIGSAINTPIYMLLAQSQNPPALLQAAAADPNWLHVLFRKELPRRYGYVPLTFLTKRLNGFRAASLKRKIVIAIGFCFDALVYVIAQIKMARGQGVGYW